MQDHVVRIYEACNFQDLAGQRIGKVITMLIMLEERLVAMIQASRRRRRATDSGIEAFTSDRTNQWSPTRWSGRTCEPTRHRHNVCLARPADRDKTNQRDRRKTGGKSQRRRIGSAFDH